MASRVRANARVLLEVYRGTGAAIREGRPITPAAEWLVDNFHVVRQQIREIREDLPGGFYRQLPSLLKAPWKAIRASSESRGHSSRIPIATSIRRRSSGSCKPTCA